MIWIDPPESLGCTEYLTHMSAKDILARARIDRASRDQAGQLHGFQRAPIEEHISAIAARLRQPGAKVPNPVTVGVLVDTSEALVADGQQRLLACVAADYDDPLPVYVKKVQDIEQLRLDFIMINTVRPLPRALLAELASRLQQVPTRLTDGTTAMLLVESLNYSELSPLHGLVKQQTNPSGVVTDTGLVRGLRASLAHGALRPYATSRDAALTHGLALLQAFYGAVRGVFAGDWEGHTAATSRLLHGTGTVALLHAMDVIEALTGAAAAADFAGPLLLIRPHCAWTSGAWAFADGTQIDWKDVQNVPSHMCRLSAHLETLLRAAVAPNRRVA